MSDGYVDELEYTYSYRRELNPDRLALTFLNVGFVVPMVVTACELVRPIGMEAKLTCGAGPWSRAR
jgi:hypothetical protein